ncbi:heterokaryon incompatibility protein [Cercophora samala]|uniref:Heterokaryon incompatibility protein n=1 Tax=Cercophora samala TaxID=330535 RepID=A0AA40DB64_9PEZI|nr:heterokaryon incompatibility protein [Cercophora samala]
MRSRLWVSAAKLPGQQYDHINVLTTDLAVSASSRIATVGELLPTRVLDLGVSGTSNIDNLTVSAVRKMLATSKVKVITTPPGARGHYLALSHRWGDDEEFKLTKPSLSSFQDDGVPFSKIPKTFQDALVVTRLLRHRYLWIDALCIVQDDVDDWARESARMAAVYSHASCTISAHTARDSNTGFLDASLNPPPTLVLRSPTYFFNPHRTISHLTLLDSFANQITGSFLNRRNWVFQERVLSRRLLHFVQHHTFFEDAAGFIPDDVVPGNTLLRRPEDSKWSVTDSFQGFVYWYRLVEKYSRCSLTYEKDRLPAIAGLAQSFDEMNDPGGYMFGLWEKLVHLGLLWINGSGRPVGGDSDVDGTPVLPSWSWACCRGRVAYPSTLSDAMRSDLLVVRDGIQLDFNKLPSFHTSTTGTGVLLLEGTVVDLPLVHAEARRTPQEMPFLDSGIKGLYSLTSDGNQFGSWVSLDNQTTTSDVVVFSKLSCLRICWHVEADNTFVLRYETTYYFLLLEGVGGSPDIKRYRRVGIGATRRDHWTGLRHRRIEIE